MLQTSATQNPRSLNDSGGFFLDCQRRQSGVYLGFVALMIGRLSGLGRCAGAICRRHQCAAVYRLRSRWGAEIGNLLWWATLMCSIHAQHGVHFAYSSTSCGQLGQCTQEDFVPPFLLWRLLMKSRNYTVMGHCFEQ